MILLVARSLDDLAPVKNDLQKQQELEEALKILCPRHENRSDKLIFRVGIDKLGHFRRFETIRGKEGPLDWRHDRELNATEFKEFSALSQKTKLRHENGPTGCFLFFHPYETVVSLPAR